MEADNIHQTVIVKLLLMSCTVHRVDNPEEGIYKLVCQHDLTVGSQVSLYVLNL